MSCAISAGPDTPAPGTGRTLAARAGAVDAACMARPALRPAGQESWRIEQPAPRAHMLRPAGRRDALDLVAAPGFRVLVVEDDDPVREHALRLVRSLGYQVREASGGEEALRLLARDPLCDILFTDVVMPGMSGGDLARAARLLVPGLAIVFMTGHHADPMVEEMRREGSAVVLTKPYRRHAAAAALREAMDCRRRG